MPHRLQLRARPDQLYLYSGRSVFVMGLDGQVRGAGSEGFHFDNTRVLSEDRLAIGDASPQPAAVSPTGADASLAYYQVPAVDGIPEATVFVEQARFLGEGLRTRVRISNFAAATICVPLSWHLAADFADTDETERGERQQTGSVETAWAPERHTLTFRYEHPRVDASAEVRLEGDVLPTWDGQALRVSLDIPAHGSVELVLACQPRVNGRTGVAPPAGFTAPAEGLTRLRTDLLAEATQLSSSNATVERAWSTAVADLASLPLGLEGAEAAPIAGLPLYQQFFGRDTLTIGWQALPALQTPLRDALRANAAWQAKRIDDWLDEEPGKMIHQARWGPLSRSGINPFTRYYGDWATVPDFLIMLGQYVTWTGDLSTVRDLLPAARRALDWIDRYADLDRDGFIEYRTRSKAGVKNQGWLDSDDAIVDVDGSIVPNPIATSELQAYCYAGLQQAALVTAALGDVGYAAELLSSARRLRRRFEDAFWLPERGYYAMALGPGGRRIGSLASNCGHLLAGGLVNSDRGRAVARRLMEPDMFSGWGIRTLSSAHRAFNPFSYHRGSVWPVEQATIGFGFARYGCWEQLDGLAKGFFDATELFVEGRLPEVIGGVQRDAEHPHPGVYPDSCEPQGWSASAVVQMVQALLGMIAVAPLRLLVVDPHLPPWLPDLTLRGVRVGDASVDIEFRRTAGGRTRFFVKRRSGVVLVVRQPPPQSSSASLVGRLAALAGSPIGW